MKARYPFKEDLANYQGKRTTTEEGIQYLRELAVLEVNYGDLDDKQVSKDLDDVQCTWTMWRKRLGCQGFPMESVPSRTGQRERPRRMPHGTVWFFLCDQGEDMRKLDGELTFKLETHVRELMGKTAAKKWSSKKAVGSVDVKTKEGNQRSPRYRKRTEITSLDYGEGTSGLAVQGRSKGATRFTGLCIRLPGTSDPQKYKALVYTGAQCTLISSGYKGVEPIWISGLSVLEAEVSLIGNEWQKHPIVTGPEAPCILGIDYLRLRYFKVPKGYQWAFGVAAVETENMIKQLSTLSGLLEDPSVVGLLRVEEQQSISHNDSQYHTNQDSLVPINELNHQLESQGVISKTRSPFNSPTWPVQKSDGEWRLTVDYCGMNKVTPLLSAAIPDMLDLQYELESKASKWYDTTDIANAFFSIPLAAECRPQFAFMWRGVQYTWNRLPQGWKHSPTICHGLIQTALEQVDALDHLQYIDDIIAWGNKMEEVCEKGKRVIQILLKAGFAIKKSKVKGPAQEIQFLGKKIQDGCRHIPMNVTNKITTTSSPPNKKETQAFLGIVGFWRMHIPGYSQLVSPLYRVT
ncbi:hypothetical protein QYF61_005555 [Mycteria americana]|uniref:ribonuclease H n=1 Tax=Mycteria americana TaxID=33587 RepID=A0AAN7MJA8_MYCAM|nr:hypothetical protein QYF61_005555 [Mycteria americana]